MTFDEIIKKEPRLIPIRDEAIRIGKTNLPRFKKDKLWYHGLKHQMMLYVGFGAENPELVSTDAYDTVYMELIRLMRI
jgi:hypothetical protein